MYLSFISISDECYLQVVGEGAETSWDGGQTLPRAIGTSVLVAAAERRTNSRSRLPLTSGTITK